jgi:hypothetical protein
LLAPLLAWPLLTWAWSLSAPPRAAARSRCIRDACPVSSSCCAAKLLKTWRGRSD